VQDVGCGKKLKDKFKYKGLFYISTADIDPGYQSAIDAKEWLPVLNEIADLIVFNHPLKYEKDYKGTLKKKIQKLSEEGWIQGLGVHNPHIKGREKELRVMAKKLGLLSIPESDFHGPPRNTVMGQYLDGTPLPFPEELRRMNYIT